MLLYVLYIASIIIELLFCVIIFYASRSDSLKEQKNLRLKFYSLSVIFSLWSIVQFGQYAINWTNNTTGLKNLAILSIIVSIWVAFFYLIFAYELSKKNINKLKLLLFLTLSLSATLVALTPGIVKVNVVDGVLVGEYNPITYTYTSIIPILLILFGVFRLERYALQHGVKNTNISKQAYFVSRGMIITSFLVFFGNYVLDLSGINSDIINIIVATSPIIFAIFIGYSVFSLRLFNFRAFFYKSIAYLAALTVIFAIYIGLAVLVANYILGVELSLQAEIILAVFSAITAIAYQPLKRFFDRLTSNIFYRDAYDTQEFINKVNSSLVGEIDLYKLLNNTADVIKKNLKSEYCNFYIDEEAAIDFHLAGTNTKIFAHPKWIKLYEYIQKDSRNVFGTLEETEDKITKLMVAMKIECIVKMISQEQNVGCLIVGPKLSGNTYASQDLQILEIIADEVAIAIQNTLRYEEIAAFNITLQKKIDDATAQLKKTNEKLVALDEAKDEFISMASHQLRTPLTSMKGYVSMVLDGDAGEVNADQRNLLDQAFASSQRMVYLIADLLNVSRLKTGKFVIEAKPTYLPDVVETEIAQLHETAKARNLELVYDKPTEFPTMNLDETKIRQVIMNFADNAIYYTPSGGKITVALQADDKTVNFTVTDTGIGVPKSEQHNLFAKFYRAGNARKARPDGTGLGLFMAKKVVVASGGSIIFKTTPGKGSVFGFSFPRERLEIQK
jgi:signal transduction histidine kinase